MPNDPLPCSNPKIGWALWLTGLPAAGKTTIAWLTKQKLDTRGIVAVVLDSDAVRAILTPVPQYTEAERDDFYNRLTQLAAFLVGQQINTIIAATANRRSHRDTGRRCLPLFAEVWVRCPVEVCQRRDSKGLYTRANAGVIQDFPGIHVEYEAPIAPELTIDSERLTPDAAANYLVTHLPFLEAPAHGHAESGTVED